MTTLLVLILLALALIGAPLFVLVGAATAFSFAFFQSAGDLMRIPQTMEGLVGREEFLAIPLFMASGAIMTAGGIARRLVDVARAALGWLPGGMAIASVAACMFFAAISGSSPVTLIAVGSIMFPAMVQSKYPENFSLGLVTTAGSLGCLVPPSISMLIYSISLTGSRASVSPEDMFLAGLVPALLIAGMLAVYSWWVGRKLPESRDKFDFGRLRAAVREGIWALLLPVVVLGGIYGGLYTPSQAGAVATAYALVITMVIYRELSWKKLLATMSEASLLMGSLILIIVLAFGLNQFLALIDIQGKIMNLVGSMRLGPAGFLLLVNVILIVLGALMDSISATLIFAPMLAPVAWELYGIDPLHFGVVFVVNMEIGYLMPPVATNLFVAAAVFKKPFGQVTRAVLPTLGITCAALALVMYVPTLSKAAINWKKGVAIWEPFPWSKPGPAAAVVPAAATGGKVEVEPGVVAPPQSAGGVDFTKLNQKAFEDEDEEESDAGKE